MHKPTNQYANHHTNIHLGPAECAKRVRRPTGDGVLDTIQESPWLWSSILRQFWDPCTPLLFPPGTLHIPPGRPTKICTTSVFASKNASKISIDFWRHFGFQNASKSLPKSIQNQLKNLLKFCLIFSSIFDRILKLKCLQKQVKINKKTTIFW